MFPEKKCISSHFQNSAGYFYETLILQLLILTGFPSSLIYVFFLSSQNA